MVTAAEAKVTSIFYNGALWEPDWFEHMFRADKKDTHKPHRVVDDFDALIDIIEASLPASESQKSTRPPACLREHLPNQDKSLTGTLRWRG